MTDQSQTIDEPVQQIVVEIVSENDGSCAWIWDAFGEERRLYGGSAKTLLECLDSARDYLRNRIE